MVAGRLDALEPGEFGIVLGADLARGLRAYPGDRITVIAPQGLVTPAGVVPRLRSFRVVGLFEVGHYEYDSGLALMHIADAQRLYQLGDEVSGVRLKLADLFEARRVARELYRGIGGDILISDWTRSHANVVRAVEIEKTMMFIILMLIVAVAAFNVVSTLVMVVTDKQSDIAILRTLGATPRSIMQVFMVQGVVIGVLGTLLGVAGGVALALNIDVVVPFLERLLKIQFLSKEVYFINELPSDLHASDVIAITTVALVLALVATVYPSWRASRVRPAEALRYE
jgi:lipoprotein-releasing system permease protein